MTYNIAMHITRQIDAHNHSRINVSTHARTHMNFCSPVHRSSPTHLKVSNKTEETLHIQRKFHPFHMAVCLCHQLLIHHYQRKYLLLVKPQVFLQCSSMCVCFSMCACACACFSIVHVHVQVLQHMCVCMCMCNWHHCRNVRSNNGNHLEPTRSSSIITAEEATNTTSESLILKVLVIHFVMVLLMLGFLF